MKRLAPLRPGDCICLVSPAGWAETEEIAAAEATLATRGFRVRTSDQSHRRTGRFAGSDEQRGQAINAAFADPNIHAIVCMRGGYGTQRAAEFIDFDLIASHPKILVGYSDVTPLLNRIAASCGFPTFHGPMGIDLQSPTSAAKHMFAVLSGATPLLADYLAASGDILASGTATAKLWGGNLALLQASIGTPDLPLITGGILLLEDTGEAVYRVDRMLNHLRRAGLFAGLQAVIIGRMVDMEDGPRPFGTPELDLYRAYFPMAPVIANAPFGHGPEKFMLPIGCNVSVHARDGRVRLELADRIFS